MLRVLGRDICALLLREQQISARQSGSSDPMREPRQYEAPLCAQVGGELWFPDKGGDTTVVHRATAICNQCIHRLECAEWGIHYERHGIWGGLTPRQRKRIRSKRRIVLPREDSA